MARNAYHWFTPSTVYNTWYKLHRGDPYEEAKVRAQAQMQGIARTLA